MHTNRELSSDKHLAIVIRWVVTAITFEVGGPGAMLRIAAGGYEHRRLDRSCGVLSKCKYFVSSVNRVGAVPWLNALVAWIFNFCHFTSYQLPKGVRCHLPHFTLNGVTAISEHMQVLSFSTKDMENISRIFFS